MKKVTVQPFRVIGIEVRTTNEQGRSAGDIGRLWERFFREEISGRIEDKINDDIYCVYTEYAGDHTQPYTTVIGYKADDNAPIPDGMKSVSIPGGLYLKVCTEGKLSDGIVVREWNKIWISGMERNYQADFEVYDAASSAPDQAKVAIFVGIP